jgi:hypothetical protein
MRFLYVFDDSVHSVDLSGVKTELTGRTCASCNVCNVNKIAVQ